MNKPAYYIIKAAAEKDFEAAKSLFRQYQQELGEDLCFQRFDEELLQLPAMYGGEDGCLLLAVSGNDYAGCVAIRRKDENTCEMKRLFVKPSYKNQGLGRELAEQIIKEAMLMQYKKMILDTLIRLTPALHLYYNLGFKETFAYYTNPLEGVIYLEKDLL